MTSKLIIDTLNSIYYPSKFRSEGGRTLFI